MDFPEAEFLVVETKEVGKSSKSTRSSRRFVQVIQLKTNIYVEDGT